VQIFGPTGSRNEVVDRNPTLIALGGAQGHGGGTTITFVDYLVPQGRRAHITLIDASWVVTTALAAGQTETIHLDFTSPVVNNQLARQSIPAAPVNDRGAFSSHDLWLNAGNRIQILSTVSAGAGIVLATGAVSGIEFDF